jgi:hypothetical protein
MCGVELMKVVGASSTPRSTRVDHSWRLSWNCSLMPIAFAGSSEPSLPSGM